MLQRNAYKDVEGDGKRRYETFYGLTENEAPKEKAGVALIEEKLGEGHLKWWSHVGQRKAFKCSNEEMRTKMDPLVKRGREMPKRT